MPEYAPLLPRSYAAHGDTYSLRVSDHPDKAQVRISMTFSYRKDTSGDDLRRAASLIAAYINQCADAADHKPTPKISVEPEPAILPRGEEDPCPTP